MSTAQLSPTGYVVLGLLALGGPATSYDLKQRVATSIGNFWSFPHSQLYAEPARLVAAGLLDEEREERGRRRRTYRITSAGRGALREWLASPDTDEFEIRDHGLLKLFFASGAGPRELVALVDAQLETHRSKLADYEALDRSFGEPASRSPQHATLALGLAVERAYIAFWSELADDPPRLQAPEEGP
jgi:DNA-binding PadR family transcriptional regulator